MKSSGRKVDSSKNRSRLEQTANVGLTISDKINNVFKCIACNQNFHNPVELTCGHMGCKRCILGLTECPLCFEEIRTIGWKNRNDARDLHQCCKELLSVFELERLQITHSGKSPISAPDRQRSSESTCDTSSSLVHHTATTEPSEDTDMGGSRPTTPVPSTVIDPEEYTCETYFDPNSEGYRPYTPLDPYPFATQLMPGTTSKHTEERTVKEKGPSITQKMPLIDTQVFSNWDTQDEGVDDKAQVELLEVEDEMETLGRTQSQPLDLTCQGAEANGENVIPYVPRRPAFPTSTFLPLDLRVPSEKTTGMKAITAAGEINNNAGLTQLRVLQPSPPAFKTVAEDFESQFTSPLTSRFVERVAVLEAPNPTSPIRATTPKRSKDEVEMKRNRKLDLGIIPGATQFTDEDDRLFLEVEDCVNLVNGNKRKQDEEGDCDDETSDDECFPPSFPEAKRPRIYNTTKSASDKQKQDLNSSKNCHAQSSKVPVPSPAPPPPVVAPTEIAEQELLRSQEDDLFASSWTPPENLLETICPARKFIFCSTRLSPEQMTKLEKLCTLCGGEIRKDFSEDITHLLLNMENNRISYTLKYLMGIARKKWILTFDWVEECLREGRIVPEEPYETSNFKGSDQGARNSRLTPSNLFHDFNFYVPYDLNGAMVSAADCKQLLTALGAVVLEDLPICNKRLLIVGDLNNSSINYKKLYETRRWLTVSWDWILECLLSYKLVPFLADFILTPGVDGIVLSQVSVPRPLLAL